MATQAAVAVGGEDAGIAVGTALGVVVVAVVVVVKE